MITESALRAPTCGKMMTYSIIVIEDQQSFIAKATLLLIFVADYQKCLITIN